MKLTHSITLFPLALLVGCVAPPPSTAMPALCSPRPAVESVAAADQHAAEPAVPALAAAAFAVGEVSATDSEVDASSNVMTALWRPRVGASDETLEALPAATESQPIDFSAAPIPQRGRHRGVHGSAHMLLGGRTYRDSLGFTGDDQGVIGVDAAFHWGRFPIGVEFGFSGAADYREARLGDFYADVGSSAGEFYLGGRITGDLARGRVRPYVGTGVTFLNVESDRLENRFVFTDDDTTVAGYVHGGAMVQFGSGRARFSIGLDVRWVYSADIELFGEHLDVDYLQIGPMFGVAF